MWWSWQLRLDNVNTAVVKFINTDDHIHGSKVREHLSFERNVMGSLCQGDSMDERLY